MDCVRGGFWRRPLLAESVHWAARQGMADNYPIADFGVELASALLGATMLVDFSDAA